MPKISITVEFDTHEEAITALATLRGGDNVAKPVADKAVKPAGKSVEKTDTPAASKPAADTKKEPAAQEEATGKGASSGDAKVYDYTTEVGPAIANAAKTHRAAAVALLTEFGAKSGKDLKAEQYTSFMEKLAEAVKPAEDLS